MSPSIVFQNIFKIFQRHEPVQKMCTFLTIETTQTTLKSNKLIMKNPLNERIISINN